MFVKVQCHTNVNNFKKYTWPKKMYNPKKGDKVQSSTGVIAYIIDITHSATPENKEPLLIIELTSSQFFCNGK